MKIKMLVKGRVQGVGFRYCTKQLADTLHIYGFAKNQDDGSVYIEASGDDKAMKRFIQEVKKSPSPSGHVIDSTVEYNADIHVEPRFIIL